MNKTFIWSDTHFFDYTILETMCRPFHSVEEMNKRILFNWRETVHKNDTIIHLGDVAVGIDKNKMERIIKNQPGKKILVMGNHDIAHDIKWWMDVGFDEVYPHPILYENKFILSHKDIFIPNDFNYINIHGHIHNTKKNSNKKINVCVEVINYTPIELSSLI